MKCSCGNNPVIIIHKAYCDECFIKYFEREIKKHIKKNKLALKNDKIAVGVSGGKDSLTTAYLLKKYYHDVSAVLIDEGIKGYRPYSKEKAEKYCKEWDIPLHIYSFKEEFGYSLDQLAKKLKINPCSICGVLRRYLLNKKSRELGFDKTATGHNLDDESQAILMNLFANDLQRLSRVGALVGVKEFKNFVVKIKPLRIMSEKEVMTYFLCKGFSTDLRECPYSATAFRLKIRNVLNDYDFKHKGAKINILKFFDKRAEKLKEQARNSSVNVKTCSNCGEHTSGDYCKACTILAKLPEKTN